jgi:hypothetical protein
LVDRLPRASRTVKASGTEHREGQRIHAAAQGAWRADIRAAEWQAIAGNTAGVGHPWPELPPAQDELHEEHPDLPLSGLAVPLVSFNVATVIRTRAA